MVRLSWYPPRPNLREAKARRDFDGLPPNETKHISPFAASFESLFGARPNSSELKGQTAIRPDAWRDCTKPTMEVGPG